MNAKSMLITIICLVIAGLVTEYLMHTYLTSNDCGCGCGGSGDCPGK